MWCRTLPPYASSQRPMGDRTRSPGDASPTSQVWSKRFFFRVFRLGKVSFSQRFSSHLDRLFGFLSEWALAISLYSFFPMGQLNALSSFTKIRFLYLCYRAKLIACWECLRKETLPVFLKIKWVAKKDKTVFINSTDWDTRISSVILFHSIWVHGVW